MLLLCITEAQNESIRVTDLKLVTAIHFRLCSPADRLLRAILACCFVSLRRCTFTHSMQTGTHSFFFLSDSLAYFQNNSSKTFWTSGYDCLIIIIIIFFLLGTCLVQCYLNRLISLIKVYNLKFEQGREGGGEGEEIYQVRIYVCTAVLAACL